MPNETIKGRWLASGEGAMWISTRRVNRRNRKGNERKNRPVKFKKAVSFRNKTKNKQINNNNNKKRKTEKVKEYLECLPKE